MNHTHVRRVTVRLTATRCAGVCSATKLFTQSVQERVDGKSAKFTVPWGV
jgi:hypothetical protein